MRPEIKSAQPRPAIGEGAKRGALAAIGMLLITLAIAALSRGELLWFGVFVVPSLISFGVAFWAKSKAVEKASSLVEYSAFTMHVPGQKPRVAKPENGKPKAPFDSNNP